MQSTLRRQLVFLARRPWSQRSTAAMPFGVRSPAARLVTMPLSEVAEILDDAQASAQDADRLKQRGLYVDVDRSGRVRVPSEVTAAEVRAVFDRARRAAWGVNALLDPGAPRQLASPAAVSAEFSCALVSAFGHTGHCRSPGAAADILLNAADLLQG